MRTTNWFKMIRTHHGWWNTYLLQNLYYDPYPVDLASEYQGHMYTARHIEISFNVKIFLLMPINLLEHRLFCKYRRQARISVMMYHIIISKNTEMNRKTNHHIQWHKLATVYNCKPSLSTPNLAKTTRKWQVGYILFIFFAIHAQFNIYINGQMEMDRNEV